MARLTHGYLKLAPTLRSWATIVTTQVIAEPLHAPDHVKVVAPPIRVNVTCVPTGNCAEQGPLFVPLLPLAPQVIPAGELSTSPESI
jgi:hypothetical protein